MLRRGIKNGKEIECPKHHIVAKVNETGELVVVGASDPANPGTILEGAPPALCKCLRDQETETPSWLSRFFCVGFSLPVIAASILAAAAALTQTVALTRAVEFVNNMFGLNLSAAAAHTDVDQWVNIKYPNLTPYQRSIIVRYIQSNYKGPHVHNGALRNDLGHDIEIEVFNWVSTNSPEWPTTRPITDILLGTITSVNTWLMLGLLVYLVCAYVVHYRMNVSKLRPFRRTPRATTSGETTPSNFVAEGSAVVVPATTSNASPAPKKVETSPLQVEPVPVEVAPASQSPAHVEGAFKSTKRPRSRKLESDVRSKNALRLRQIIQEDSQRDPDYEDFWRITDYSYESADAHVGKTFHCPACNNMIKQYVVDSHIPHVRNRLAAFQKANPRMGHGELFNICVQEVRKELKQKKKKTEGKVPVSPALQAPSGAGPTLSSLPEKTSLDTTHAAQAMKKIDKKVRNVSFAPNQNTTTRVVAKSAAVEAASSGFGMGRNPGVHFVPVRVFYNDQAVDVTAFRLHNNLVVPTPHMMRDAAWGHSASFKGVREYPSVRIYYGEDFKRESTNVKGFYYESNNICEICLFFLLPSDFALDGLKPTSYKHKHSPGDVFKSTLYAAKNGKPVIGEFEVTVSAHNGYFVQGSSEAGFCGGIYFYTPTTTTALIPLLIHTYSAATEQTLQIEWSDFLEAYNKAVDQGNGGAPSRGGN